jgi:branched-chain amino acid transport system permease protein
VHGAHWIGFSPVGGVLVLLAVLLPLISPFFGRQDVLAYLVAAAMLGAQAVAFDFTAGYINVANFGFAAFVGLGAYTSALLNNHYNLTPWLGMICGALVAAAAGFLLGAMTLRLRGMFAAVMAWFFGLAIMGLALNLTSLTRGALGLSVNENLLTSISNRPDYYFILALLLITYGVLHAITRSRLGLAFKALGQNIEAARASGVNPTRYRVLNFTLSCAFGGLVGGFYAHYIGILTPDMMATSQTVQVLIIAYVGGRGSLWGSAVIAFPAYFFTQWLRTTFSSLPGLDLVVYAAVLILIMTYYPRGLAGAYESVQSWLRATWDSYRLRGAGAAETPRDEGVEVAAEVAVQPERDA